MRTDHKVTTIAAILIIFSMIFMMIYIFQYREDIRQETYRRTLDYMNSRD